MTEWFTETLHEGVAQALTIDKVRFRQRTDHQDLIIFENRVHGRVLALDGVVQVTTGDEFVYHEMIAHVPLLAHGRARRVLIIGGGDGGTARRCLCHPVDRVTMVEIDRSVVDLCCTHMPEVGAQAFDDPRLDLVIADGAAYVAETDERFDVIIIDSTDPIGPGQVLFTPAFYAACHRCLTPGGILVNQAGVPALQASELTAVTRALRTSFADVWAYTAVVPTYYGGIMTLGWASDDPGARRVDRATLVARAEEAGIVGRYYSPAVHVASFALPPWIEALITTG